MKGIVDFLRHHQRSLHAIALASAVVLYLVRSLMKLQPEITNGITLSLIAYVVFDISINTSRYSRNTSYPEQSDMYRKLEDYVLEKGAREAVLIQYSGRMSASLVRALLRKGANVTLYIQDPAFAVSKLQRDRIEKAEKDLLSELRVPSDCNCSLKVYYYRVPASIRAVRIDKKVLAIGWYTYEHMMEPDPNYPDDKVEISGHDTAGALLFARSSDYTIFNTLVSSQLANFRMALGDEPRPVIQIPSHKTPNPATPADA